MFYLWATVMSKTLKLEISVADLGQDGVIVSEFATTDYVASELAKKADLNAEGKVDPSLLPDYTYVDGLVDKLDDVEQSLLNSDAEILNAAKLYLDNKIAENNSKKADLVEGKVPFEQLPFSMNFEQNVSTEFGNVRQELRQNSESIVSQMEGIVGSANSYTDGKVIEEREFLNNTINEYKGEVNSQLNAFDDRLSSVKSAQDDIIKNGASLPFDSNIEYFDGALTLKEGVLQQFNSGIWTIFKKKVDAIDVVDESGFNQQDINDNLLATYFPLNQFYSKVQLDSDFTNCITRHIQYVSSLGGGTILIPDGIYYIDIMKGVPLASNIHLQLGKNTRLKAKPTRVVGGSMFKATDTKYTSISGGFLDGNRDAMLAPDNKPWKQFRDNTTYQVGDYVWIQRWGCIVTTGGTTVKEPSGITVVPKIGNTVNSGTVAFQCVEDVGEWGFGIDLRGVANFRVTDCHIDNWWGDGIYVGRSTARAYCSDVSLEDVNIDNCRRQGVSVITAKGFSYTRGRITNINGAAPMAGIDLEPNTGYEYMNDVYLEDVHVSGCSGNGFHIYLQPMNTAVTAEDRFNLHMVGCTSKDNASALYVSGLYASGSTGNAKIEDCRFYDSHPNFYALNLPTVNFNANNPDNCQWTFRNCIFQRANPGKQANFRVNQHGGTVFGGVHFYECTMAQTDPSGLYDAAFMSNNASAGMVYRDISVINPRRWDFATTPIWLNQEGSRIITEDKYGVLRIKLTKATTMYFTNWVDSFDVNGNRLTLSTAVNGMSMRINNFAGGSGSLVLQGACLGLPLNHVIPIPPGGWVDIACISNSTWFISDTSCNTFIYPKGVYVIESVVIQPNTSLSQVLDYSGAETGGLYSLSSNQVLLSLGLVAEIYSQASNKLTIVVRNNTNAAVTLPKTTFIFQRAS